MGRTLAWCTTLIATCLTAGCVRVAVHGDPDAWAESMGMGAKLRVATYNTSLYDDASGGLIRRLETGDAGARKIAAVLQRVRPDLALLNEFDYDAQGRAANLFQHDCLEVAQAGGGDPLRYPYRYLAPVNTGVSSGLDLNHDGTIGREGRARGDDAWGFGLHPGQYGMLVLSRYPIDTKAVRTFQLLKWSAMPDARQPRDAATDQPWYPPQIWTQLRLSSKSHWDVPVRTPEGVVHFLVSHPTPPVFDGPEDRNGARNADELRLWQEYLSPGPSASEWLCDDQGHCGRLSRMPVSSSRATSTTTPSMAPGGMRPFWNCSNTRACCAIRRRAAKVRWKPHKPMRRMVWCIAARPRMQREISDRRAARCDWITCCPRWASTLRPAECSGPRAAPRMRRLPTAAIITWFGWISPTPVESAC
jgi:Endonuclease/Exonuclease/phosphatase family